MNVMKKNWVWLVIGGAVLIGGLILVLVIKARQSDYSKIKHKDLGLAETADHKVAQTDCYGFLIPKSYADSRAIGCNYNAYAEALKDNWINVDGYEASSAETLESEFRARKLDLSAQTIVDKKTIQLDGKSATTMIDEYKSNGVRYASTLVFLGNAGYRIGGTKLTGFEIRGKYTTDEDKRIYDQMLSSWRWR